MRAELTCTEAEESGFPERYAAGTLDDESLERFESHFLTCRRCQDAVQLAATVRRGAGHASTARIRRIHFAGIGAALAAGLAFVGVLHFRRNATVRALGRVGSPPAYAGVPVRGETSANDSAFAAAMAHYAAGHYHQSAQELRALLDAGAPGAPVGFFLGASLLEAGDPIEAAAAFARVISTGDSPYLTDAHYYRALALLQAVRPDSAAAELRAAGRGTGASADSARVLLRDLETRVVP